MDKKVLFRIGTYIQHKTRFGETAELYRACYFRGKELGYKDGNIYFEWPLKVSYNKDFSIHYIEDDNGIPIYEIITNSFKCPTYSILPIEFINYKDTNENDFDEIVDLINPGSFYDDSPPIYTGTEFTQVKDRHKQKKSYVAHWNYFNKYFIETGERPIFDIKKDTLKKQYILFHVRIAKRSKYRNPNLNIYGDIIKLLREKYGDKYEFWKCGEPCRELDKMFDYVAPYYDELNDFLKLVNNATLFICNDSGPNAFGYGLGIPIIEIEVSKVTRKGGPGFLSKEYWEKNGQYGETSMSWVDEEKFRTFFKGDEMDHNKFMVYADRWLNG